MNDDESYQQELRKPEVLQKHLDSIVQAATDAVVLTVADIPPRFHHHLFYGSTAIQPAIWLFGTFFIRTQTLQQLRLLV